MKIVLALCAVLMYPAMPVSAMSLQSALEVLKLENEQIVSRSEKDRFVVRVVSALQADKEVSQADVKMAVAYCQEALGRIGTPKLRKALLRKEMAQVNREIEIYADRPYDGFERKDGMDLSYKISMKISGLMGFEAERYQRFLEILVDDC